MEVPQSIKIEIYPGNHRVGWCRSCLGNLKLKRPPRSTISLKIRERMSHAWHGHRLKRKRKMLAISSYSCIAQRRDTHSTFHGIVRIPDCPSRIKTKHSANHILFRRSKRGPS